MLWVFLCASVCFPVRMRFRLSAHARLLAFLHLRRSNCPTGSAAVPKKRTSFGWPESDPRESGLAPRPAGKASRGHNAYVMHAACRGSGGETHQHRRWWDRTTARMQICHDAHAPSTCAAESTGPGLRPARPTGRLMLRCAQGRQRTNGYAPLARAPACQTKKGGRRSGRRGIDQEAWSCCLLVVL